MVAAKKAGLELWKTMGNATAPPSFPPLPRPLAVLRRSAPFTPGLTLLINRNDGFPGWALRVRRVGGRWWWNEEEAKLVGGHGSGEGGDKPRCGGTDPRRPIGVAPSWSGWSGGCLDGGWGWELSGNTLAAWEAN